MIGDTSENELFFKPPEGDPGDDTQLNFRYQHSYGVAILLAAASGRKEYNAIWCEHHEDILVERKDGKFDAIQVKTQKPELGAWDLKKEAMIKSLIRFVSLNNTFDEKINNFIIASNTEFSSPSLDTTDTRKLKRSPFALTTKIKEAGTLEVLPAPFAEALSELAEDCQCQKSELFVVLKKLKLIKGPSKEEFDSTLAHEHLPNYPYCKGMSPAKLNAIRDELIQLVYRASSLGVEDPLRHLYSDNQSIDPIVLSKRVSVEDVKDCINKNTEYLFRYLPESSNLGIGSVKQGILEEKLLQGGLSNHVQHLKKVAITAEQNLMELAIRDPENAESILAQLEGVVQGECLEAEIDVRTSRVNANELYGERMLNQVFKRLRSVAKDESKKVCNQPYENLLGVAGLLTEQCSVWWSDRFQLKSKTT